MRRQFMMIIVARGMGSCIQALLLVIFARAVDPAAFGLTSALLGVAAVATVIFDLGITTYIVRVWAFDGDSARVRGALRVNHFTSLSLGVILTLVFALYLAAGQLPLHLSLLGVWVALEKSAESYLSVHIAKQNVLIPTLSIMIRRIIPLVAYLILMYLSTDSVTALTSSLVIGGVVGQLHVSFTLPREVSGSPTRFSMSCILVESRSFGIANFASQLRNADTSIVGIVAGLAEGGSFAAATKLTIPIYLVASALSSSIMPAVARAGRAAVTRIAVSLFVAVGIGVGFVFVVRPWLNDVMTWIFGDAYAGGGQLLMLVLLGTLVASVGFPLAALLQSVGLSGAVAGIEGIMAGLFLTGITIGAAAAGAEGAAWGALCAQLIRAISLSITLFRWNTSSLRDLRISCDEEGATR